MRVLNLGMPESVNNRRIQCDLSHRSVRDRDWPELKVDGSLEMTVYVLPTPVFSADDVQARLRCCRIGGNEKKKEKCGTKLKDRMVKSRVRTRRVRDLIGNLNESLFLLI